MRAVVAVALFLAIGCSHRESSWGRIVDGSSASSQESSPFTVGHRPTYVELFFYRATPPSDKFSYSDALFAGKALTVYAQVGPNMVVVDASMYRVLDSGSRVEFLNMKTLWPECSSVQISWEVL